MIAPQPFKLKCPKCGYSKVVKPKSDVFGAESIGICPICKENMKRVELNFLDKIFRIW